MNLKQKIALVAVPGVLALGGGALAVQAATVHPATAVPAAAVHQATTVPAAAVQTATDPTEPAESTTETVEANEPAIPGGGNADAPGTNVDHQFEGVE